LSEIASDISVRFFKRAAHEWQGILITKERKAAATYEMPVNRLDPIRAGTQLDEIVIPHDVENWQSSADQQIC